MSTEQLKEDIVTFETLAQFRGPERQVFTRIASDKNGNIIVDLGNAHWQAVKITDQGWSVVDRPPVALIRKQGMAALPVPKEGGGISLLDPYLNLASKEDRVLFLSMVLSCFHPKGPFPLMLLAGEQGSGKSTLCRIVRSFVDPSEAPVTTLPRNERDLYIAATKSWLQVFDNVSRIEPDLSDWLCRLSTGGGLRTRKLFTDDEEKIFSATRPVIINSIIQLILAGDLADRSLVVRTKRLNAVDTTEEAALWPQFEKEKPLIFGALLTAVSTALKNLPGVVTHGLPRMADFAKWCIAGETGLGLESGSFLQAYEANRTLVTGSALDASSVHEAILTLIKSARDFGAEMSRHYSGSSRDGVHLTHNRGRRIHAIYVLTLTE
jgi:energy-coupling factor transporter ATP-binding protein EcfA2